MVHFLNPEMYFAFIPGFLPKFEVVYLSGLLEIILGILIFYQPTRYIATFGVLILMIVFLPLHFVDMLKNQPAIGNKMLAYIRFPVQLILVCAAWFIHKKNN